MDRDSVSGESTELPSELIGRTPRKVRMTGTGWLNVFAAAFFVLLGVAIGGLLVKKFGRETTIILWPLFFPVGVAIFGLLLVRRFPLQRRLAMEGIGVRGCITDCLGPSRAGFVLHYTFRNADNDEVEIGRCPSDHSRKVGSNVWILYLPADPSRSEIYPFDVDFFRIDP